jgi:putative flippase GtrA
MIGIFKTKEFVGFILAGGTAALVNFGSRFFYSTFADFGYAVILAYITGMITAFTLNKLFVFEKSGRALKIEVFYFILVNLVAVAQTYYISIGLVEYLFPSVGYSLFPEATAHAAGVVFPVFSSFIGHKYLTFREFIRND